MYLHAFICKKFVFDERQVNGFFSHTTGLNLTSPVKLSLGM